MAEPHVSISLRGIERLISGHLWIYRSDLRHVEAGPGDIVRVTDERGRYLARAFYSDRSQIAIRVITRDDVPVDRAFFTERFRAAADFRQQIVKDTEVYRLVYAGGDALPALVVDRYRDYFAIQTLSQGSDRYKNLFVEILVELFSPRGIVERNDPKVRLLEGLEQKVSVLSGEVPAEVIACENGVAFAYDLLKGQKTGGFLDQRENRREARVYAKGEVLDCFCYQGGFALTVANRADHVEAVDLSAPAIEAARLNAERNQISNITFREANTFDVLKEYDEANRRFDMVILDPPAFAKNRDSIPAARRGYKEINLRALKLLKPGGYLITSSCSHHIVEPLFLEIVAEAANDVRRPVACVDRRTQARDHPIVLTMPETHYLKCLIVRVLA